MPYNNICFGILPGVQLVQCWVWVPAGVARFFERYDEYHRQSWKYYHDCLSVFGRGICKCIGLHKDYCDIHDIYNGCPALFMDMVPNGHPAHYYHQFPAHCSAAMGFPRRHAASCKLPLNRHHRHALHHGRQLL